MFRGGATEVAAVPQGGRGAAGGRRPVTESLTPAGGQRGAEGDQRGAERGDWGAEGVRQPRQRVGQSCGRPLRRGRPCGRRPAGQGDGERRRERRAAHHDGGASSHRGDDGDDREPGEDRGREDDARRDAGARRREVGRRSERRQRRWRRPTGGIHDRSPQEDGQWSVARCHVFWYDRTKSIFGAIFSAIKYLNLHAFNT